METAKQYLIDMITPLVSNKEDVRVEVKTDEKGVLLTLFLHKEDMGKIIGKAGATVQAVRMLVRMFGMANQAHVSLIIAEPVR